MNFQIMSIISKIVNEADSITDTSETEITGMIHSQPFKIKVRLTSGLRRAIDIDINGRQHCYNAGMADENIDQWFDIQCEARDKQQKRKDAERASFFAQWEFLSE